MKHNPGSHCVAARCDRNRSSFAAIAALFFVAAGNILPLSAKSNAELIADKLPGLGLQPVEYFYTGKPYDADTETYTFKYRNYDPELNRWTSVDPNGFPDGPNNQVYAPNPMNQFDPDGLAARATISNLTEALEHWSSNAGGTVPSTDLVDAEIRGYSDYATHVSQIKDVWGGLLESVSKSDFSGSITRTGITWGVSGGTKTVGSVDLAFPSYTINWNATPWDMNGQRVVTGAGTLQFSYNDEFNFVFDPNNLKTIFTDVIPSWWAGDGTPFYISGSFSDSFSESVTQYE